MSKEMNGKQTELHRSLSVGEIAHLSQNFDAFREGGTWVRTYLAQPHPELGRPGTVCPFAQAALDQDSVLVAVVRLADGNRIAQIVDAIEYHLEAFVLRAAKEEKRALLTTLIMFPDVSLDDAPELIDRTKEDLKTKFIQKGLMLGEFHARNDSPGLHNPDFRPLRSPIPMLAIRHMVPTDYVFLDRLEYDANTRLKYLEAYLAVPSIPRSNREAVERAVASLRGEVQN